VTIPQRLLKARERAQLTQHQVAQRLGLKSKSAVCEWEKGVREPTVEQLRKLARLYSLRLILKLEAI